MFGLVPGFINSKYSHPLGGTEFKRQGNGSIYADTLAKLQDNQRSYDGLPSYQGSPSKYSPETHKFNHFLAKGIDTSYSGSPTQGLKSPSNSGSPLKDSRFETKQDEVIGSPKYASNNIFAGQGQEYNTLRKSETYKNLMPSSVRGSHNPITNPLPVNVQNPYLLKEIYSMSSRRPYFANMASSNLVG